MSASNFSGLCSVHLSTCQGTGQQNMGGVPTMKKAKGETGADGSSPSILERPCVHVTGLSIDRRRRKGQHHDQHRRTPGGETKADGGGPFAKKVLVIHFAMVHSMRGAHLPSS